MMPLFDWLGTSRSPFVWLPGRNSRLQGLAGWLGFGSGQKNFIIHLVSSRLITFDKDSAKFVTINDWTSNKQ